MVTTKDGDVSQLGATEVNLQCPEKEERSARTSTTRRSSSSTMHDSSSTATNSGGLSLSSFSHHWMSNTTGMNDSSILNAPGSSHRRGKVSGTLIGPDSEINEIATLGLNDLEEHDVEEQSKSSSNRSFPSTAAAVNTATGMGDPSVRFSSGSSRCTCISGRSFVTERELSTMNDPNDNQNSLKSDEKDEENHNDEGKKKGQDQKLAEIKVKNERPAGSLSGLSITNDRPKQWYEEDWIIDSIQPFPSPVPPSSSDDNRSNMMPDAHAVGEPARLARTPVYPSTALVSRQSEGESDAPGVSSVNKGAAVVDNNERDPLLHAPSGQCLNDLLLQKSKA